MLPPTPTQLYLVELDFDVKFSLLRLSKWLKKYYTITPFIFLGFLIKYYVTYFSFSFDLLFGGMKKEDKNIAARSWKRATFKIFVYFAWKLDII